VEFEEDVEFDSAHGSAEPDEEEDSSEELELELDELELAALDEDAELDEEPELDEPELEEPELDEPELEEPEDLLDLEALEFFADDDDALEFFADDDVLEFLGALEGSADFFEAAAVEFVEAAEAVAGADEFVEFPAISISVLCIFPIILVSFLTLY
jgi:hypothetical protein